jgi:hypothetical protein
MSDPLYMVAVAGLSLTGLASAIRLIEWLIRTDPRIIAQIGRWSAVGLAALSAPLLLALLINEKWMASMVLAAMMLFAFAWYGPRLLQRMRRYPDATHWSTAPDGNLVPTFDASAGDPELVRRSISVLEEYLRRVAALPNTSRNGSAQDRSYTPMSEAEALDILGLGEGASEVEINDAYQRLHDLFRPEYCGSQYLSAKINEAKDLLIGHAGQRLQPAASAILARKHPRRRSQ